ncbi:MAG: HEAT repeat domain-containing protein [Chloroflexota bacterium]
MSGHIFISYARTDGQTFAERLDTSLQSAGFETWRDTRSINEYQDFSAEIEIAIRDASHVAVCITPSLDGNPHSFVRRELIYADSIGKPIIPLVFPGSVIPTLVNHLTWISFYTGKSPTQALAFDQGFSLLAQRLSETVEANVVASKNVDPYRDYLQALYERIIYYLNQTVFSLVNLRSTAARDAVNESMTQVLPMAFFDMAGIMGEAKSTAFANFSEAFAAYHGRTLLLGDPGAGKTTTLMAFARDAVWKRLENPALPVPILAPIATWNPETQPTLVDWLAQAIPAFSKTQIATLIEGGNALLLLDGLDELGRSRENTATHEHYDPRERFLRLLPPHGQIIVSCRVKDYAEIGSKAALDGAVTLQALDDQQMRDYLQNLPNLWSVLETDNGLLEMARTPLILALFRYAFADQDPQHELHDLSQGDLRDKIFETYIQRRYERELRKPNQQIKFTLEEIQHNLGHVAVWISGWISVGENIFSPSEFNQILDEEKARDFIDLALQLHLLVSGERNSLRFVHLLLRDYFAYRFGLAHLLNVELYDAWGLRPTPARSLGFIGDKRAVEPMIKLLENSQVDASIRNSVAGALGDLRDARALPALLIALKDPDVRVYGTAIIALSKIGDERALPALLPFIADNTRYLQTFVAVLVMRSFIHMGRVADVIASLNDPNPVIRDAAAGALGREHIVEAVPQIIPLLADDSQSVIERVCDVAAFALKRLGTTEALAAVEAWRAGQ